MLPILLQLKAVWESARTIVFIVAAICLIVLSWWYFIRNPKVISNLEADKAELTRQVDAKDAELKLLESIKKGQVRINEAVYSQISTLHAQGTPRRTVIIRGGMPLKPIAVR